MLELGIIILLITIPAAGFLSAVATILGVLGMVLLKMGSPKVKSKGIRVRKSDYEKREH